MRQSTKIQTVSARLYRLFFILLFLLPAFTAGFWVFYNDLPRNMVFLALPADISMPMELGPLQRTLCFFASLITLTVKMAVLLTLMRLFRLYQKGQIFSGNHVACFKRLAKCLVWYLLARVVQGAGIILVLTMNNPVGQRMLHIGMTSDDLTLIVIAVIALILAWVMDEGRKICEDQALTI